MVSGSEDSGPKSGSEAGLHSLRPWHGLLVQSVGCRGGNSLWGKRKRAQVGRWEWGCSSLLSDPAKSVAAVPYELHNFCPHLEPDATSAIRTALEAPGKNRDSRAIPGVPNVKACRPGRAEGAVPGAVQSGPLLGAQAGRGQGAGPHTRGRPQTCLCSVRKEKKQLCFGH